jgi:polar amino acid transport system substrate-binding protein
MKLNSVLISLFIIFTVIGCTPPTANETTTMPSKAAVELEDKVTAVTESTDIECKFNLGFDAWEPYQYADVGGRVAGLDIELVVAVTKNMGCEIEYRQGTWVDLLTALKNGEVDMLLGASKTEARENFALFSDAYRVEEFSLYIRNDDDIRAEYKTLSEFVQNSSRIGIVEDYFYGSDVSMLLDDPKTSKYFVNAIMGELNVARLLDADIDGYFEDSFVGASLLRRKALSNYIVAHGITIQTGSAYVMFGKESITQAQLSDFNTQLKKIKNSKTYQDILAKYSY